MFYNFLAYIKCKPRIQSRRCRERVDISTYGKRNDFRPQRPATVWYKKNSLKVKTQSLFPLPEETDEAYCRCVRFDPVAGCSRCVPMCCGSFSAARTESGRTADRGVQEGELRELRQPGPYVRRR